MYVQTTNDYIYASILFTEARIQVHTTYIQVCDTLWRLQSCV